MSEYKDIKVELEGGKADMNEILFWEYRVNSPRLNKSIMTGGGPVSAAWSSYYQYGDSATANTPRWYGIIAFKNELIYNGFGKAIVNTLGSFGDAMRNRVVEFQKANGLEADGVIGPSTARRLFKKRITAIETARNIPNQYLNRQTSLESLYDPGAVGFIDQRDRGLNQINSGAHPDVSDAEAFNPEFSLDWSADFLLGNRIRVGGDWEGAVVAHNIGWYYAKKWVDAGKPASGLVTSTGKDYAVIATNYLNFVKKQNVS